MDKAKLIETQKDIIHLQSEIIDQLFIRLAQAIPTEDLFAMPEIDTMNRAAELRESIGDSAMEDRL